MTTMPYWLWESVAYETVYLRLLDTFGDCGAFHCGCSCRQFRIKTLHRDERRQLKCLNLGATGTTKRFLDSDAASRSRATRTLTRTGWRGSRCRNRRAWP